jgi:uncharacterized protein (TIGR02444 family)
VGEAALALQDDHGQCVSLMLWRAWTVAEGRPVSAAQVEAAMADARVWESQVTAPLRSARRAMKGLAIVEDDARVALRARVQAAELDAERLLLEALESRTPQGGGAEEDLAAALAPLAAAWNGKTGVVGTLVEALEG